MVELGKVLASELIPMLKGAPAEKLDSSTAGLLQAIRGA